MAEAAIERSELLTKKFHFDGQSSYAGTSARLMTIASDSAKNGTTAEL